MKDWKKELAAALAVTMTAALPGTALAADAETTDKDAEVAQMKEEIAQLTARLNALEQELQEEKAQKAEKKDEGKDAKKHGASELKWSGSTKTGYMYNQDRKGSVKAELRLKAKTKVDDTYDVAFGLKFKSTSEEPVPATGDPKNPKEYKDGHSSEKKKSKLMKRLSDARLVLSISKQAFSLQRSVKASGLARVV